MWVVGLHPQRSRGHRQARPPTDDPPLLDSGPSTVGVAQLVELLVVVQAVGGSSPLAHPSRKLGICTVIRVVATTSAAAASPEVQRKCEHDCFRLRSAASDVISAYGARRH